MNSLAIVATRWHLWLSSFSGSLECQFTAGSGDSCKRFLKLLRFLLSLTYSLEAMLAAIGPSFLGYGPYAIRCQTKHQSHFRLFPVCEFPSFLPKEIENIKDPFARKLASRIQRVPVQVSFSNNSIMSSCVKPTVQTEANPLVLLHGFDRYIFPLLEEAGLETWAVDILGWGFSDLKKLPSCGVASKRDHLYQFWKTYIKRPMTLVGPSLGAAIAIDFVFSHPEAVDKLILIDASVYAEGTGDLAKLPRILAYTGVFLLKSIPLRLYATSLTFNGLPFNTCRDWTNIGRLHCLLPWWEDATVDFMISGGYNVIGQIKHVKQKTLIVWGENDQIIDNKLAVRLHCELPNAILRQIPECGHLPHVEKADAVSKLIVEFVE